MAVYKPLYRSLEILPDPLALHRYDPERYPYPLESVVRGTINARYSLVFAFPGAQLILTDPMGGGDFLTALDALWHQEQIPYSTDAGVPFRGGWFLYLGYELAGQIEPRLRLPAVSSPLPRPGVYYWH